MCPEIVSGIVNGDVPVPTNSPGSLCDSQLGPVFFYFLKQRIVLFSLKSQKCISFKYKIKEHLPRLLWTWYPLESEQVPRYPTCYLEKWRVPEEECPQDLSEVACYHCKIQINLLSFDIKLRILFKLSSKFNFVISPLTLCG